MTDQKKLEEAFDEMEMEEDESCPKCGGDMLSHISYWYCEACGHKEYPIDD
jgi:ribosomal protein S27AE